MKGVKFLSKALLAKGALCSALLLSLNSCSQEKKAVAVVTSDPIASKAAYEILQKGGSAADAFITATLIISNTEPQASGLGGGFLALYYDAKKNKVFSIDAREETAKAISADAFINKEDGKAIRFFPERQSSKAAVGVPGVADGLDLVWQNFGKLSLEEIIDPAIQNAKQGFKVSNRLAQMLSRDATASTKLIGIPRLAQKKSSRSLFFKTLDKSKKPELSCDNRKLLNLIERKDSNIDQSQNKELCFLQPLEEGDILINADYAKTLEILRDRGFSAFYSGSIAEAISKDTLITKQDLKNYRAVFREPIRTDYINSAGQELEIYGMGPPSSGGIAIAQMLNILDNPKTKERELNLKRTKPSTKDVDQAFKNILLKSKLSKIAYQDRNIFLADEDFVEDLSLIKKVLLSQEYLNYLRDSHITSNQAELPLSKRDVIKHKEYIAELINQKLITDDQKPFSFQNKCLSSNFDLEQGTAHMAIQDQYGNVISATTTIENLFGNGTVVEGFGFLLNNELTDFDPIPGHCNSIEPGYKLRRSAIGRTSHKEDASQTMGAKRPRSSMSPTIVTSEGKPVAAIGAAGGSTIISSTFQVLINLFEYGMTMQEAVAAQRMYNLNKGYLRLEDQFFKDEELMQYIDKNIDDDIKLMTYKTASQGIFIDNKNNRAYAAADPRRNGLAINE